MEQKLKTVLGEQLFVIVALQHQVEELQKEVEKLKGKKNG